VSNIRLCAKLGPVEKFIIAFIVGTGIIQDRQQAVTCCRI